MPNETNKNCILQLMDETRLKRQRDIKNCNDQSLMSVQKILTMYPRFKDYEGELVSKKYIYSYLCN